MAFSKYGMYIVNCLFYIFDNIKYTVLSHKLFDFKLNVIHAHFFIFCFYKFIVT